MVHGPITEVERNRFAVGLFVHSPQYFRTYAGD